MPKKEILQIGYDFCTVSNIITAISSASEVGYNKYYVPIAHPRYKREFSDREIIKSNGDDFSRSLIAVYPQGIFLNTIFQIPFKQALMHFPLRLHKLHYRQVVGLRERR